MGLHRPHLPWDVPEEYFNLYPPGTLALADHNKPPANYGAAANWSWDPQSGPRHCGVLKQMSQKSHPQLPEFGLVPDPLALEFRRAYFAAVSSMDRNVGLVLDKLEALGLVDNTIVSFIG